MNYGSGSSRRRTRGDSLRRFWPQGSVASGRNGVRAFLDMPEVWVISATINDMVHTSGGVNLARGCTVCVKVKILKKML